MLKKDKPKAWATIEEKVLEKVLSFENSTFRKKEVGDAADFFIQDVFNQELTR